jgi:flagellar biosynthesis chaperone FliJ
MVTEASTLDVQRLKQVSEGELSNLKEYISLLNGIIDNLEEDILTARAKAKEFLKAGQQENYGHLMERISETIERIETCRKCVEECTSDLARKEARIKDFNTLLGSK